MSVTIVRDLRPLFGAIRDQGNRPTCLAVAVSDAHAAARGPYKALSVEQLYFYAVQRTPGGHPSDGVSLPTALEALRQDGQAVESGWPYLDPFPTDVASWRPPATATPVFRREYERGRRAIDAVIDELDRNRPVVMTMMITESFCAAPNGLVPAAAPGANVGYHAVIAVGHGHNGSQQLVLVRNSWGAGWGNRGYGWVDVDFLAPRLNGIAMMGDEKEI